MKGSGSTIIFMLAGVALAMPLGACDPPECIEGPSNLTPEATASCVDFPAGVAVEDEIVSAGAERLEDGTLVLTWSSNGLGCGTRALDVGLPGDCMSTGWTLTAEIPASLAAPGVIDLAAYPEVRGSMTVTNGFDGGSRGSFGDEPFFVGEIELVSVGDDCVTGVLHSFGTGDPDPTLGGPELNGGFVAPVCGVPPAGP